MYNYYLHLRTYLIIKQKQFINAISFRKNNNYTPFAILCEPRTGSTLLHTYLNYHPNIISYGEVLREKLANDISTVPDVLNQFVFKPHAKQIKAVGFKLFYSYYQSPLYQEAFQDVINRKEVKIIHLVRKDVLQQYVSLKTAEKTKLWSGGKNHKDNKREKILVDEEDLKRFLNSYLQNRKMFQTLFQKHNLLSVTYEDLSHNPTTVLEQVQKFLEIKHSILRSLLQKQNTTPLETFVENYANAKKITDEIMKKA